MNVQEVSQMLAIITRSYGAMSLQVGQAEVWADHLCDIDARDAAAGMRIHIQTSERIPTIADITKQAKAARARSAHAARISRIPQLDPAPTRATSPGDDWFATKAAIAESIRNRPTTGKHDPTRLSTGLRRFADFIEDRHANPSTDDTKGAAA